MRILECGLLEYFEAGEKKKTKYLQDKIGICNARSTQRYVETSLPLWEQIERRELMGVKAMLSKSRNKDVQNALSQHVRQMPRGDLDIPQ